MLFEGDNVIEVYSEQYFADVFGYGGWKQGFECGEANVFVDRSECSAEWFRWLFNLSLTL